MRCSRCGEEYKENQVFCIKCGSPIHVVPDFDLIEAELANSVGKLMSDKSDFTEKESVVNNTQNYIPNTKRDKELDILDISKKPEKDIPKKPEENSKNNKKNKGLLIGMIIAGVVVLILVAIILANTVFSREKSGDFDTKYESGMQLFDSGDYEAALDELLIAEKLADTDAEKIQINEALLGVYEMMEGKTDEIIQVLITLIELSPNETTYYDKLATVYNAEGMLEELQELINSAPESVYNDIKAYGVSAPEIIPGSGDLDEVTSVVIGAENSNEIYFTLDGSEPTKNSTKYTEAIVLSEDGKITLKAVAYGVAGFPSKVTSNNYTIEISVLPAPVVTPVAGPYTEPEMITVVVPEGYTAYYTYSASGSAPTTSSEIYTVPIAMTVGNNIFKVIVVSPAGKLSEVTTMIYKLSSPTV